MYVYAEEREDEEEVEECEGQERGQLRGRCQVGVRWCII